MWAGRGSSSIRRSCAGKRCWRAPCWAWPASARRATGPSRWMRGFEKKSKDCDDHDPGALDPRDDGEREHRRSIGDAAAPRRVLHVLVLHLPEALHHRPRPEQDRTVRARLLERLGPRRLVPERGEPPAFDREPRADFRGRVPRALETEKPAPCRRPEPYGGRRP